MILTIAEKKKFIKVSSNFLPTLMRVSALSFRHYSLLALRSALAPATGPGVSPACCALLPSPHALRAFGKEEPL